MGDSREERGVGRGGKEGFGYAERTGTEVEEVRNGAGEDIY